MVKADFDSAKAGFIAAKVNIGSGKGYHHFVKDYFFSARTDFVSGIAYFDS